MLPPIIKTERLLLRPFSSGDTDDVFGYASDPKWRMHSAAAHAPYLRADAVSFIARRLAANPNDEPSWAIEHEQHVCGSLKLRFFYDHRAAELGYGVARRAWGQGIAVEACHAVMSAAFKEYAELVRFRARSDARNTQSIRVMSKLGMSREAFLRSDRLVGHELVDEVIYGLLRREWSTPPRITKP